MLDVAVIGAGPYGLSAAAHLRGIEGLEVQVFGRAMSFWEGQMPRGMLLRSPWAASHLSDPDNALSLESYVNACGNHVPRPIPGERFVDYGRWFQSIAVPDLDQRQVVSVTHTGRGFLLRLEDETEVAAHRVVIAAGIAPFARYPEQFRKLPSALASHTSEHRDLGKFRAMRVAVVGGGQSALESAALLKESGADVEVLVRAPRVHFLVRSGFLHRSVIGKLLYAPTDVGPAGVSRVVAAPGLFRTLPRGLQDSWRVRCMRPAGAAWLVDRLSGVPLRCGIDVTEASEQGGRVALALSDGSRRSVDHVMLGTGYAVDISRYEFLSAPLRGAIRRSGGFPRLSAGFETSVPGLHIVGAPAAWSFGPLLNFVAGAPFMGRRLARSIKAPGRAAPAPSLRARAA